jgi:LacI family transcriptional regulator
MRTGDKYNYDKTHLTSKKKFYTIVKRLRKRFTGCGRRMKNKKHKIDDVARKAGVSIATVSHVINGTRFVSDETKRKVNDAISELEYVPSSTARSLASNRSKLIGIVFSDITNPFFPEVYKALENILTEHGYDLILANTGEVDTNQERVLRSLYSQQIDGLIIAPTGHNSTWLNKIIRSGVPVVIIDRTGPYENVSVVELNNIDVSYKATSHLISDGHNKIGIILGLSEVSTTMARLEGYKKALDEFRIPFDSDYVVNGRSRAKNGYLCTKELMKLKGPPTAIYSTNNLMTNGVLHAFKEMKLSCPQDIGLLGFDDHHWGDIFTPPLTVIRQPTREIGIRAANALINKINSKLTERICLDGELIVRCSCSIKCFDQNNESGSDGFFADDLGS